MNRTFLTVVLLGLSACSRDSAANESTTAATATARRTSAPTGPTIDLRAGDYKPGALTSVGSVKGTIVLAPAVAIDSMPITADSVACGETAVPSIEVGAKRQLA